MNTAINNGFQLLNNGKPADQTLGLFGLIALDVSLEEIAKVWSISIFDHVRYTNTDREGIEFGEGDFHWEMIETYNYNVKLPGIHDGEVGSVCAGHWYVSVEFFLDGEIKTEDIGIKEHGFNPALIEKYFLRYLKKWESTKN